MAITSADLSLILSCVSQLIAEGRIHVGEHGVAVAGSWSATDVTPDKFAGTVEVVSGKTAAIIGDDGDTGIAKPRIDIASTALGDQYAPRGNERVVMIPTETSPIGVFLHGNDDTDPTLLPGERKIRHFNVGGNVDVYVKWKNDGKTANDGLGSLYALVGALLTLQTTNGTSIIIDDATSSIQLAGSGTTATDGLVRKSDLQSAINTLITNVNSAIATLASHVQSGSGTTPSTVAAVTATASTKSFTA